MVNELMRRRALLMARQLPYEAEIEYLGSTGSAYIDTGIEATGDLSIDCRYLQPNSTNSAIAGAILKVGNNYVRHHLSPQYFYNNTTIVAAPIGDWATMTINATDGEAIVNGVTRTFTPKTFDCQCNYALFARFSSNMALQSKEGYFSHFKLFRGNTLLRDFIPVRVGQVGYMYDKVSGALFGNEGTGSFILGNDK